jgi:hypothetical protein
MGEHEILDCQEQHDDGDDKAHGFFFFFGVIVL